MDPKELNQSSKDDLLAFAKGTVTAVLLNNKELVSKLAKDLRVDLTPRGHPPACADTQDSLAFYARKLPKMSVFLRKGAWRKAVALLRLLLAYSLGKMIVMLKVQEAWRDAVEDSVKS